MTKCRKQRSVQMELRSLVLFALLFFLNFLTGCGRQQDSGANANQLHTGAIIVGDLGWKDVTSLAETSPIRQNSKRVADLDLPSLDSRCTAFLIGEDILMTNQHCITSPEDAVGAKADFGHETGKVSGRLRFDCSEFIGNNEEFDFALLRCKGSPGKSLGVVTLSDRVLATGEALYLIQQNCDYYTDPKCDWSKKYALGTVLSKNSDGDYVHDADTLGGSSGSPVFSAEGNVVVALHHAGRGNNGRGRGLENYAVPMSSVVKKLKSEFPLVAAQIGLSAGNPAQNGDADPFEPNDTKTKAALVALPFFSDKTSIKTSTDVDWFKFSVVKRSVVKIDLKQSKSDGDLDVIVYSSSGRVLYRGESSLISENLVANLGAGVYYLRVYGYKGATNAYTLKVSK